MNYTNLIECSQAHLPVHYASNIELIRLKCDIGIVIDSEPHPSRTCKSSLLFAPLAVHAQAGCSAFPVYTPTKPLQLLYFKYITVLTHKLEKKKIYILDFYNKM